MYDWNRVTRVTRVTGMNRMTRVRYLSSYLEWVSHQEFKNIAYVGCFRYFVVVFIFVFSYDFWIAFVMSFQNMYGYMGLWSLWAALLIIFELMTHYTHIHTTYKQHFHIDSAHPVGWAEWKYYGFIIIVLIVLRRGKGRCSRLCSPQSVFQAPPFAPDPVFLQSLFQPFHINPFHSTVVLGV